MLNPYTLNTQESLKHAWHWDIGFLRYLAAKVLSPRYFLTDRSKAVLLLWFLFVICLCHTAISLSWWQLLGKGWRLGFLVCDVSLCFCHFPICQACFKNSWVLRVYGFNTEYLQNHWTYCYETFTECCLYIKLVFEPIIEEKTSHVTFGGHFGSHIQIWKCL